MLTRLSRDSVEDDLMTAYMFIDPNEWLSVSSAEKGFFL